VSGSGRGQHFACVLKPFRTGQQKPPSPAHRLAAPLTRRTATRTPAPTVLAPTCIHGISQKECAAVQQSPGAKHPTDWEVSSRPNALSQNYPPTHISLRRPSHATQYPAPPTTTVLAPPCIHDIIQKEYAATQQSHGAGHPTDWVVSSHPNALGRTSPPHA
jgi:hypothetical protein